MAGRSDRSEPAGPRKLEAILERIDGRGYKAYRELLGRHDLGVCSLHVDHVQADPFAAPSRMRLRVAMERAGLPQELWRGRVRRIALADFLAREVRNAISAGRGPGGDHGGLVTIDAGGQEVLERTAVRIERDWVEARVEVGLPAAGRRVLGRRAQSLLTRRLPGIASRALHFAALDGEAARRFVECVENQETLRDQLHEQGLIAFVADGSILPRESGASDRPLPAERARPFRCPDDLRVTLALPNPIPGADGPTRRIEGLGIGRGVTLIVGGGYHGKSTLLRALECGVHPHVPGDGREYVVAARELVKIRAEDGRSVTRVDIHPFVREIPDPSGGTRDTRAFSSAEASGSTSQAAAIVEAIEAGARGLLLDEDTCASNFMLRDARMQRLVASEHEPITPFVERVRELYEGHGVSTVLVMGGSGDYFEVADRVILMRAFEPEDVTGLARRIAREHPSGRLQETRAPMRHPAARRPLAAGFHAGRGRRDVSIKVRGRDRVLYGDRDLDLRHVSQLRDASQTRAVALAIALAGSRFMGRREALAAAPSLPELLDALEAFLDEQGLSRLSPQLWDAQGAASEVHPGALARPRRFEIAAAINRLRGIEIG